jgi:hypothetical protein
MQAAAEVVVLLLVVVVFLLEAQVELVEAAQEEMALQL